MVKSGVELLQVLQYILIFFHFVVCNCLFAKNFRSYSDIGEMKDCFRRYVSLKNFNFLVELMSPNLRFRFTVVVIKSRRLPGDQRSL